MSFKKRCFFYFCLYIVKNYLVQFPYIFADYRSTMGIKSYRTYLEFTKFSDAINDKRYVLSSLAEFAFVVNSCTCRLWRYNGDCIDPKSENIGDKFISFIKHRLNFSPINLTNTVA